MMTASTFPVSVTAQQLPDEVLALIFRHAAGLFDLLAVDPALAQTCKRWRAISYDPSIWREVAFSLEQTVTVDSREHPGRSVGDTKLMLRERARPSESCKSSASSGHRSSNNTNMLPTVWHRHRLESDPDHINHFTIYWPLPSARFLAHNNPQLPYQRFRHIQTLSLRGAGESITDFHLRDTLLPMMPALRDVDFTSCYMLGDLSVRDLVRECGRGERLEVLRLAKCFGLSARSLMWVAAYCQRLRVLDLSDGSGACQDSGLSLMIDGSALAQESRSHSHSNLHSRASNGVVATDGIDDVNDQQPRPYQRSTLPYTLETLNLSGGDFLTESALTGFLARFTAVSPATSRLRMLDISNTFCVSPRVLDAVFGMPTEPPAAIPDAVRHYAMANKMMANKTTTRRTLTIRVRNCDQLMASDVQQMVRRVQMRIQNEPETFGAGFKHVHAEENCKFIDDSVDAVRRYISAIRG